MNDRPTPETDAETNYCDAMPDMPWIDVEVARRLERERDEAREALENHMAATIHTCHDECKRPMCVLRRERDEARELADRYRAAFCSLKEDSVPMPFPWEGGTSPTANPPEKE